MADDICGPSNALQNFQKHSTVDRTLQQDRLTARQLPSQGFRSLPGPNTGILDAEFQAFQAGQFPLLPPEAHGYQSPHPAGVLPLQTGQPSNANWADDFQRMKITSPKPQQHNAPQDQQLQGGWEQDFLQQHLQNAGPSYPLQHAYNAPAERLSTLAAFSPIHQHIYGRPISTSTSQPLQTHAPAEVFDEEAFARAFDQAAATTATPLAPEATSALQPPHERLGADLIHDPDGTDPDTTDDDPDALARTAADLLERVKNNTSDKFRNSQFLQLMRQIRDKDVVVEGDRMVDVHSQQ